MACGDKKARFHAVILDPVLARSVPRQVAVATGIDAVSHAIERYVTTNRNPISQMFAGEAWRLLEKNFEIVLNDSDNIKAWGNMLLGAHFAGAAIENSMLGAAHACANPLTARFDITHGVAVGVMLPYVIKFNSTVVNGSYQELGRIHHASNGFPGDGVKQLLKRIDELKTTANMPKRLKDLEIDKSELYVLAKDAAAQWTGQFNPRPVSETELLAIYETAY